MYRFILFALIAGVISAQTPYSSFCLQNRYGPDQQNHFPDTTDCHYFIYCNFVNNSYVTGIRMKCPDGQFWRPSVVSCLPEGEIECVDRCLSEDDTHTHGCYAGTGCRQYFSCSNTGSYGMCCPLGTSFVESSCKCKTSTCKDICIQKGPGLPETLPSPEQLNDTLCRDAYGSIVAAVSGEAKAFNLLTEEGIPTAKQYCAEGTLFSLATCRCDIEDPNVAPPPTTPRRRAVLMLTFDSGIRDTSTNKFETYLYDGAERDTANAAHGTGSLAVNGGFLTVPGLKSLDLQDKCSACFFFHGTSGGLLSNNRNDTNKEFTWRFLLSSPNNVAISLKFWHPKSVQSFDVPFTNAANSWNHCCTVYSNNLGIVYLNGKVLQKGMIGGSFAISHAPLRVGNDPAVGSLNGNIDEVIVTNFVLTPEDVENHRTGNYAALEIF